MDFVLERVHENDIVLKGSKRTSLIHDEETSTTSCDMTVPSKTPVLRKSNFTCNNKDDCSAGSSKGINSNLSYDNQKPHSNSNINNLEIRQDTTDVSAEDDIEIIYTLLAKEVKKKNAMGYKLKSTKCLNDGNESDHKQMFNSDDNVNGRENPNLVGRDDQAINCEIDLQMTDDKGVHTAAVECDRSCDESPIELKKKHEPKMRFLLIDVVDFSDDKEGLFPYSQFDSTYEDNMEIMEIIECAIDDEPNTEKIGLLNVDDEVVILTDSEDEANPRLSRNQLLNEDIKPISCDVIIKDETDVSCISQAPYNEEISSEPRVSVDVETKNKKDDHSINLLITKLDTMDVDEAGTSNDPSMRSTDKSK